jgi:drug/metabolite transporter (DMT)-like permease
MAGPGQGNARKGLLLALAGFAVLASGDVVVKTLAGEWPASAVAALRWVLGAAALFALVAAREGRTAVRMSRPWLHAGRGAAVGLASLTFFLGVHLMPLADAMSIVFTSPMLTALISAVVLRERITRAAAVSIGLAFAGTLIVLRPNLLALGPAALLPLAAALGLALLFLLNRRAAGGGSALGMQLYMALWTAPMLVVAAAVLHAAGLLPVGVPDLNILARVALVALAATTGHLLIYRATELASAATIAPMIYVQILVAIAGGWLVAGEVPGAATLTGAALIIAGGLWLWRSKRSAGPA